MDKEEKTEVKQEPKTKKKFSFSSVWNVVIKVIATIGMIFTTLYTIFSLREKSKQKIYEDIKKDEIEKKDAADIIADSPNPDTIQQSIENEQDDFRRRVRDRLNKNI